MEKKFVVALQKSLADTFVLYAKVHSFHWNITGNRFLELHAFFEEIYTHLWNTLDTLAEEMRMSGEVAPKNIVELKNGSSIAEETSILSAEKMLETLSSDLNLLMQSYQNTAEMADDEDNEALEAVMYGLVAEIRKTQWKIAMMK